MQKRFSTIRVSHYSISWIYELQRNSSSQVTIFRSRKYAGQNAPYELCRSKYLIQCYSLGNVQITIYRLLKLSTGAFVSTHTIFDVLIFLVWLCIPSGQCAISLSNYNIQNFVASKSTRVWSITLAAIYLGLLWRVDKCPLDAVFYNLCQS